MNMHTKIKGNGTLPLALGFAGAFYTIEITGGPYDDYQVSRNSFGVCVRAERVRAHDVHVPIHDFDVPKNDAKVRDAVAQTLIAALTGRDVYVGCMGGWGRTGLFLALVAKAAGVDDPIEYVRQNYTSRAIETKAQEEYVKSFDVRAVQLAVRRYAWRKRLPILRWFGF